MSLRRHLRAWFQSLLAGDLTGLLFSAFLVAACLFAVVLVVLDLTVTHSLCLAGYIKFC